MTARDDLSFATTNGSDQNILAFKNINLTLGDRKILHDIYGEVSSQNILALMGPSGSGKSSLLNVLSYRRELLGNAVSSGCITLNDVPLSKKDRYRIGYVMQEDIFFPTLTLYETLTIKKLAQYMHLEKLMGGGIIRGLSGGERKRASVACELIIDSDILMLDEPTSGLDSFMAANVINILKDYCRNRNKIVIASIHQPSSQIFHCFDHLVLLASGKLAYKGFTQQVSNFFADCGFQCPQQWNIADYMLEVLNSNEQSNEKIIHTFKILEKGKFNGQNKNGNNKDDQLSISSTLSNEIIETNTLRKKWPAGMLNQFKCLVRRNFLLSIEDQLSLLSLSESILISLFLGTVWFNLQWDTGHFQDILGLLYYMIVESFSNPFFTSVFVFGTEKPVISKERMSSMYSLLLYYTAKVISELPALFIRPLIHTIIVYPMTGLPGGPTFLLFFLILSLTNILGMNFGLFLSSMGLRQKETLTLMVIFFVVFNLYGGFFVSKLPKWLKYGKYLSPMFSFFVLLTYSIFSYKGLKCDAAHSMQQCTDIANGGTLDVQIILDSIQADISYWWFIIILFGTSIILNIVTFLILRKTITKPATGFKICELFNPVNIILRKYKNTSDLTSI